MEIKKSANMSFLYLKLDFRFPMGNLTTLVSKYPFKYLFNLNKNNFWRCEDKFWIKKINLIFSEDFIYLFIYLEKTFSETFHRKRWEGKLCKCVISQQYANLILVFYLLPPSLVLHYSSCNLQACCLNRDLFLAEQLFLCC